MAPRVRKGGAEGGFVIAWFLKTVSELLAGWKDGRAAERLASYNVIMLDNL